MIVSVLLGNKRIVCLRKRPKETSFKARTARAPFGKEATKELRIPAIIDRYNYYIRAVNKFNYLIA
jgi:hypothetical protein